MPEALAYLADFVGEGAATAGEGAAEGTAAAGEQAQQAASNVQVDVPQDVKDKQNNKKKKASTRPGRREYPGRGG